MQADRRRRCCPGLWDRQTTHAPTADRPTDRQTQRRWWWRINKSSQTQSGEKSRFSGCRQAELGFVQVSRICWIYKISFGKSRPPRVNWRLCRRDEPYVFKMDSFHPLMHGTAHILSILARANFKGEYNITRRGMCIIYFADLSSLWDNYCTFPVNSAGFFLPPLPWNFIVCGCETGYCWQRERVARQSLKAMRKDTSSGFKMRLFS